MEELEGDGEGIPPPRAFEEGWRDLEGVREDDSAGLAGTRERERIVVLGRGRIHTQTLHTFYKPLSTREEEEA